jgi:ComF family protein
MAQIVPIVSGIVHITEKHTLKVVAISDYKDPLRSLILSKNSSNIVASTQLGTLVWEMTVISQLPVDYFIPVPLHWSRFAKRGFNQAHEIANVLAHKADKPVVNLLKRVRATQFQATLSVDDRATNLTDALVLKPCDQAAYQGKHLVLVDDLMTTGSTLKNAARQLLKLKPASLTAVVACRVV